ICNTKRHYSVFKNHPQAYYIPWGVNIELFKPKHDLSRPGIVRKEIIFFHSVGMSLRKGTSNLIQTFISGELYKKAKLVIHSQLDFEDTFGYSKKELKSYNIEL